MEYLKINNEINLGEGNEDKWISQFNTYFQNETCFANDACCNTAGNYILSKFSTSTERANQIIIAENSSSDCSNLNSNGNLQIGINLIDKSLNTRKLPIMVGVHHPYYSEKKKCYINKCSGNSPNITNHYIIIVGSGFDYSLNKKYYLFWEVGTSNPQNGRSNENKLYIDSNNLIIGNTKYVNYEGYYTVTEVRKNNGQTY